jgi:hypothetical protein
MKTTPKNAGGGGTLEVNPLTKITGQRAALDYPIAGQSHTIMFMFVAITEQIANDWLKSNRKNRKLKEKTVTAYNIDMRNNAWLLTHQGIAFDEHGNLVDGQHRLMAILQSKRPVTMLVSFGWPTGEKRKTMDAVDRGVQRSLADQLALQHGIVDAKRVVIIVNDVAAACMGLQRVFKSTTDSILAVFEIYSEEIKWLLENPVKAYGLRSASLAGCMALAYAVYPEKTVEFYRRLITGENLSSTSPILHLRNYLIGQGASERASITRLPITYHLCAFVEGKNLSSLVINSNTGLLKLLTLQQTRVNKIRGIYMQPEMVNPGKVSAAAPPTAGKAPAEEDNSKLHPTSAAGLKVADTLSKRFSILDLKARLDGKQAAGYWASHWMNKGWIEPVGVNEFLKTETFGK